MYIWYMIGIRGIWCSKEISYSIYDVGKVILAVGYSSTGELTSIECDGVQLSLDFNEQLNVNHGI